MNDPIGLAGQAGGAGGADALRKLHSQLAETKPGSTDGAAGFKDVLMQNLERVNKLQQDATEAVEDLAAGRRDDLETVLMATQKADTAFRMLLQVRNQVMSAYDEIKQIRV
jgi:flagellar hook-basal body complex protein FliE